MTTDLLVCPAIVFPIRHSHFVFRTRISMPPGIVDVTRPIRGVEDLVRKVELVLAPWFGESFRTSASGAALLDEALQVGRCFNLLHNNTHYMRVSIVNFGMIHTLSRRSRRSCIESKTTGIGGPGAWSGLSIST